MCIKYNQVEKNIARDKLIVNAIHALTYKRSKNTLVTNLQMKDLLEHFLSLVALFLEKQGNKVCLDDYKEKIIKKWEILFEAKNEVKAPHQLKVLYLAGPQPTNDLEVLLENGVKSYNIWAIEGGSKEFKRAVEDLKNKKYYIRLHKGSLKSFFESYPEQFDIVYFDACTPLFSNGQNPLEVLQELFINRRLTNLSALITNFSEPDSSLYGEWGKILASWYAARFDDCPFSTFESEFADINYRINEIEKYTEFITNRIPEYYSDFIPRFIASFASEIMPFLKITTFKSISLKLFKENQIQNLLNENSKIEGSTSEEILSQIPHYMLAAGEYPLLNWVRLSTELLSNKNPLKNYLNGQKDVFNSIITCTQLKSFDESYTDFNTLINEVCSEKLIDVLNNVDFFDRNLPLTVNIPMKNLITELIIGQYSFPYIANLNSQLSLKYKANGKKTWMYSDVFLFDQCRYLYDLLPTLEQLDDYFKYNIEEQIIIRCCIDGILRNHYNLNNNLLKGGFIEDLYDKRFFYSDFKDRKNINAIIKEK